MQTHNSKKHFQVFLGDSNIVLYFNCLLLLYSTDSIMGLLQIWKIFFYQLAVRNNHNYTQGRLLNLPSMYYNYHKISHFQLVSTLKQLRLPHPRMELLSKHPSVRRSFCPDVFYSNIVLPIYSSAQTSSCPAQTLSSKTTLLPKHPPIVRLRILPSY